MKDTWFSSGFIAFSSWPNYYRGSWVSSLTKIELALEILHTCSSLVQDNSKKSKQYLEEEKLEEEIKSRSLEQKPEKLVAPVKLMPS